MQLRILQTFLSSDSSWGPGWVALWSCMLILVLKSFFICWNLIACNFAPQPATWKLQDLTAPFHCCSIIRIVPIAFCQSVNQFSLLYLGFVCVSCNKCHVKSSKAMPDQRHFFSEIIVSWSSFSFRQHAATSAKCSSKTLMFLLIYPNSTLFFQFLLKATSLCPVVIFLFTVALQLHIVSLSGGACYKVTPMYIS